MLLYYSKRTILAASRMLNSSFRRLNSFLPKKEGPSSVILKVLFIYYTVHIISHAGPLPVCEEFVIDSLLNYRTVFSRCIDQQYQVLSLAVMVHDITVADRCADGFFQSLCQSFQHGSFFHRSSFAVHNGTQHKIDRLSAPFQHPHQMMIDPAECRITAQIFPFRDSFFFQIVLDVVQYVLGMHHLVTKLVHGIQKTFGRF